ncbi:PAS domain-containing protein [Methylobacterium sp. CB376]|uniref:PAS domain-containing protein n=1 Tax=unclassified Methylobacterium TaxID=2615210 RepID=UPI0003254816|nr:MULTISPECIES: PAS domain-containing protein [Methylobacterium]WFT81306.1 PAS domain-containing protein [Methylobacterium nodulans]
MTSDWNDEPPIAQVFDGAGTAVYTTDAEGWLTYYNPAAAALWGYRPEIGRALVRRVAPPGARRVGPAPRALPDGGGPAGGAPRPRRRGGAGAPGRHADPVHALRDPDSHPLRGDRRRRVHPGGDAAAAPAGPVRGGHGVGPPGAPRPRDGPGRPHRRAAGRLAALADVEVTHEIECEHLEARIGPGAERERILAQLRAKRERGRSALRRRLGDLQARAAGLTAPAGAQGAAVPGRALLH